MNDGAAAVEPRDEMVDGSGGLRPHWRPLLGPLTGLGREALADRQRQLDAILAEEGKGSVLPGAEPLARRCDPIPFPIGAAEFAALEAGLVQRARVLSALLDNVYGQQRLLADGVLPPSIVYPNPAFLRPCSVAGPAGPGRRLHIYAAELIRGPDGGWRVLADRTADAAGTAYALQNRRALARVMPELFRLQPVRRLRPFFELWEDRLQRLAPSDAGTPGVALLTPGPADKLWFEHVLLARELACHLVEPADLTVRGGGLFLKTLRGLQPVHVLLRRQDGRTLDPLELEPGTLQGTPGLLDVMRAGRVQVVNDPGVGFAEAPALAAFLPAIARHLLGETLILPSVETLWMGDDAARRRVLPELARWRVRPALDGTMTPMVFARLSAANQARLRARITHRPEAFAVTALLPPSVAPCLGTQGFTPRPVVLRLFLLFDGRDWQAMPGGLARCLSDEEALAGRAPLHTLAKDVWVAAEEEAPRTGVAHLPVVPLLIRRPSGDLPSRVADDFFWLGRYLERLEGGARLLRLALSRLSGSDRAARDRVELESLLACLDRAELLERDAAHGLGADAAAATLLGVAAERGKLAGLLDDLSRLAERLRDRLTEEVYAQLSHGLQGLAALPVGGAAARPRNLEPLARATTNVLSFTAAMAGLAAENMVRGGGRLFLDLGRRIERGWAGAGALAQVLDQPGAAAQPARLEPGLRLALELCDSVITYRTRYVGVLQPAAVLDLVLADGGNPRSLAFQLVAARELLAALPEGQDPMLGMAAAELLAETQRLVADTEAALDQYAAAVLLPEPLRQIRSGIADLSDRIARQYFAVLPVAQSLGVEGEARRLRGMA